MNKRDKIILRIDNQDKKIIEDAAKYLHLSLSEYVRTRLIDFSESILYYEGEINLRTSIKPGVDNERKR